MSEMSDYLEAALIDTLFRSGGAFAAPTDIYLALSTATITDATTGTTITEPSGGFAYARKDTGGPSDATWDDPGATSGQTANTALQQFAQASGGNWGTITDVMIVDAATVGNSLFYTAVDTAKSVDDGDTAEFAAGAITVTLA